MKKRLRSFRHAFRGIGTLLATQANARIHLVALVAVLALGFITGLNPGEWALISIASGLVLSTEAMNSALEALADHTAPEWHDSVGKAKDLAAAAVLLASIIALAVGLLVFLPHI